MDAQTSFKEFAAAGSPPPGAGLALQALWHETQGNWERAHELAQEDTGRNGAWVHAYLHRREGDTMNAGYWYSRAGRTAATGDLDAERAAMVRALLAGG